MKPGRTIIELCETHLDGVLQDGMRATERRLGLFANMPAARRWLRRYVAERGDPDPEVSHTTYEATEFVVGPYPLDGLYPKALRVVVYDATGHVRGRITGDRDAPWGGRDPRTCAFKEGELVGLVCGGTYRVGIVCYQPESRRSAARLKDFVTRGDDCYHVGIHDPDDPDEHAHMREPYLWCVAHEVPSALRAALRRRFARTRPELASGT